PDAEVLEFGVDRAAGSQHLSDVAPVHADLMDRTVDAALGEKAKDRFEEGGEFRLAQLTAAHGEFAVTNAAKAADMTIDGDIVGRIGEHEFRLGAVEQPIVGGLIARIPAQQAMAAEQPQITGSADRGTRWKLRHRIFWPARGARLARFLQDE